MRDLRVKYLAPFAVASGYARAAADYLMTLQLAGVDLSIQPLHDADSDNLEPRYAGLLDLVGRYIEPTHVIVHTIPRYAHEFVTGDMDPGPGVKKICVTTWETDRLAEEDAKRLDEHFDAVILPCRFNMDTFLSASVPEAKLHRIPYGFDPNFWWVKDPPAQPKSPYVFYDIGVWSERKNPIGLLKAYLAAFRGSRDDVLLRIVCPNVLEDDVQHLAKCSGLTDLPKVEFITQRLSETELRDIHYQSHCYVTTTRGEAWGLGAFEAALCGNPVIAPEFGGQRDFLLRYSRAYWVPYTLTPAITPEVKAGAPVSIGGITFTPMKRAVPIGIAGDQNWAEPDLHATQTLMRAAYGNRAVRKQHPDDRDAFETFYSYANLGRNFRACLESI